MSKKKQVIEVESNSNEEIVEIEENSNEREEDEMKEEIDEEYYQQILNQTNSQNNQIQPNEKKRIVISKRISSHALIYQIENWCQLGNDKIILFDTNEYQLYELKRIPIEFGCWYFDSNVIEDGSYTISSKLDPFFVVLHFIQLNNEICLSTVSTKESFCLFL